MKFNKLALAAAITAVPMTGMAMEPMQDEALAGVTGQDGLSIGLGLNVTQNINIIDRDGVATGDTTANYSNAGAIQITGMGIDTQGSNLTLDIDAGGDGTNAQLNVVVGVPAGTTIETGAIGVAESGAGFGNYTNTSATIIPSTTITLTSGAELEINLGSEGAGEAFINMNNADLGTISFTNFSINDADGSSIDMAQLDLTSLDATGTTVNVEGTGLVIDLTGSNLSGVGMQITDLSVNGGTDVIGDVEITGLDLTGSTVTINGK